MEVLTERETERGREGERGLVCVYVGRQQAEETMPPKRKLLM